MQGTDVSEVYEIQDGVKETIKRLQQKGPAVFIGRCATEILKYHPDVVRTYIYTSNEKKRIFRIAKTDGVSEEQAKWMMEKKDRERRNYFRFLPRKIGRIETIMMWN